MTAAGDAPVYLDWSRHRVNTTPKPCRMCKLPALMTDHDGIPAHKVCAEAELARHADFYAGGAP